MENLTLLPGSNYSPLDTSMFTGRTFAEHLLEKVRKNLEEFGDKTWITNGTRKVLGSSSVFGETSHTLGEVEGRSRQMARILYHKFGVRRGDVVHMVMPSNTEMYFPVLGTWLLQAVVSPADPGLSLHVLTKQWEDVTPKVIVCCVATLDKVRQAVDIMESDISIIVMDRMGDSEENIGREFTLVSLIEEDKTKNQSDPPSPEIV